MLDYDADVYGWAIAQAALLRAGRLEASDAGTITEEIESIGRSERRKLMHRLTIRSMLLLEWSLHPA